MIERSVSFAAAGGVTSHLTGARRGYYLVKGNERHFISDKVDERALDRVCKRVLSDKVGWDYWIDFSSGLDVRGAPAWSNVDQTDRFL